MKLLFLYLVAINIAAFCMMGADKRKAKLGVRRIPEKTLLGAAFLGGALGEWLGMRAFRHKTKHKKFAVTVPILVVLQAGSVYWLCGR